MMKDMSQRHFIWETSGVGRLRRERNAQYSLRVGSQRPANPTEIEERTACVRAGTLSRTQNSQSKKPSAREALKTPMGSYEGIPSVIFSIHIGTRISTYRLSNGLKNLRVGATEIQA
jgi:hypothetical protein